MANYVSTFKASYTRAVGERGVELFDLFYKRFIASDPRVAIKFAHTDLEKQKAMLKASLTEITLFFVEHQITEGMLELARIHSAKGHNIAPEFFDKWLECLLEAVSELDPEFNDDVELAWRLVLTPGIVFMKFGYDK